MIICSCFGVIEADIQKLIDEGAENLESIIDGCYATMGCGSCKEQIEKMLIEKNNTDGYGDKEVP